MFYNRDKIKTKFLFSIRYYDVFDVVHIHQPSYRNTKLAVLLKAGGGINLFLANFPNCTLWRHQKTRYFLVLSGSIKWENWLLAIVNILFKLNPSVANFPILYPPKTQENQRFSGSTQWEGWPETGWKMVLGTWGK